MMQTPASTGVPPASEATPACCCLPFLRVGPRHHPDAIYRRQTDVGDRISQIGMLLAAAALFVLFYPPYGVTAIAAMPSVGPTWAGRHLLQEAGPASSPAPPAGQAGATTAGRAIVVLLTVGFVLLTLNIVLPEDLIKCRCLHDRNRPVAAHCAQTLTANLGLVVCLVGGLVQAAITQWTWAIIVYVFLLLALISSSLWGFCRLFKIELHRRE